MASLQFEKKVFEFIEKYQQVNNLPPTRKEIMIGTNCKSNSNMDAAIIQLKVKGLIEVREGVARGVYAKTLKYVRV